MNNKISESPQKWGTNTKITRLNNQIKREGDEWIYLNLRMPARVLQSKENRRWERAQRKNNGDVMYFNQRRVKGEDRTWTTATLKSREVLGLGEKGKGMGERDGLNEVLQWFFCVINSIFYDMDLEKKIINEMCHTRVVLEWYAT